MTIRTSGRGRDRIRVLQLIGTMHIGGAERVLQHLVSGLDRERFSVDVCCTKSTGSVSDELVSDGHRVISLAAGTSRRRQYAVPLELRRLIARNDYDVVHTHDTSVFLDGAATRMLGVRASLVQTFHFGNYPHIKRRYLYAQRLAWRTYERLVAVSEAQRRALIEHVWVRPERITTIYNGVADNVPARQPEVRAAVREEFGIPPNAVVAGCIATMTAQKGIPHLLEAAASVNRDLPHVHFIIVGGGPLFEEMRGVAAALNLGPGVRFTNWRKDAVRLLAGFDVLVSSSLWEGFAMVLLEGMAAAKPIVATDVGDNSVAVADGINGFVVPAGDSGALARAIASAAADPVRLQQMGCASHERFTRTFTVARMVEQYAALYEAVWERQRSPQRA